MSKLLKLKDWLTLEEAARHLSIMFGEDVTSADILRLALDRRMTLSVYFVNHAKARPGRIKPLEEATFFDFPIDIKAAGEAETPEEYQGGYFKVPRGIKLNTEHVIELEDEIVTLAGVYNLPMIGTERLDVEHEFQLLTSGPAVTLQGLDGAFVEAHEGELFQIQESFDENEFQAGSRAHLRELKRRIEVEGIEATKAEELLNTYKQQRSEFKAAQAGREAERNYYPAAGLPNDSVLVVRTAALAELQAGQTVAGGEPKEGDPALSTRERDTLLKLVIGMAIGGYGYDPGVPRSGVPTEISEDMLKRGITLTDDTVRKWLKIAAATVLDKKAR